LTVNIILISHERIRENATGLPVDSDLPADDPNREITGEINTPIFPPKKVQEKVYQKVKKEMRNIK